MLSYNIFMDISIARFKRALKINKIDKLSTNPPILHLFGDFSSASEVRINNQLVREWFLQNEGEIYVSIPPQLQNVIIENISVISESLEQNIPNLVFFELGTNFNSVSGIQLLLQNFMRIFAQSPDSNKFRRTGGGLIKLAGKNMLAQQGSVKADIVQAVNRTKNYLIREQQNQNIPLAEKLLDAQILGINTDRESPKDGLILNLLVTNKLGQQETANLTI